jgi:hypothetical protein
MDDPGYQAGLVDLLGLLSYGELQGFARLAADAAMADNLVDQAAMSAIAVNELRQFERLRDRLVETALTPVSDDSVRSLHRRVPHLDRAE